MKGRFITLEGSRAGKSTNVDTVCATLEQANIEYVRTREPGGTPMAEALRAAMLESWEESVDGLTELLLVLQLVLNISTTSFCPPLTMVGG